MPNAGSILPGVDDDARRVAAARSLVQRAGRLARERLEAARRDRKLTAALVVTVGSASLVAWAFLLVFDMENAHARLALGLFAALAQCAPLYLCAARCFDVDTETVIANAVESTLSIETQAKRLGDVIKLTADRAGPSPTSRLLVATLLDDVERAAMAANDRERRIRGSIAERTRRHTRIKPRHDRVTVTTHDGRRLLGTITDVSVSGVAIEGNFPRIPMGAEVAVGSRSAKAVRVLPEGMAFEFAHLIPAELLDTEIIL